MDNQSAKTIEDIPFDIFREIFRFVPTNQHFSVSTVNKKFYSIICDLYNISEAKVTLNDEILDDCSMISSIISTERRFKYFDVISKLNEGKMSTITHILKVHGAKIKEMSLTSKDPSQNIQFSSLLNMLSEVPDIVSLELALENMNIIKWYPFKPVYKNVKTLTLYLDNVQNGERLIELFEPNTLQSVCCSWNVLKKFLNTQKSIKHIFLSARKGNISEINPASFEGLILSEFALFYDVSHAPKPIIDNLLMTLVRSQPAMTSLEFTCSENKEEEHGGFGYEMTGELIEAVCDLRNLQEIHLIVTAANCNAFHLLSRLPETTAIRLDFWKLPVGLLTEISLLQMPNFKTLIFGQKFSLHLTNHPLKEEILQNMGRNWENVNYLKVFSDRINLLNEYFENFEHLESLHIDNKTTASNTFFYNHSRQYPQMKHLTFNFVRKIDGLLDLLDALPNLETFSILTSGWSKTKYSISVLRRLNEMKTLVDLKIILTVKSLKATPSDEEVELFRSIMRRLLPKKNCGITIIAPALSPFNVQLANRLQAFNFIKTEFKDDLKKLIIKSI